MRAPTVFLLAVLLAAGFAGCAQPKAKGDTTTTHAILMASRSSGNATTNATLPPMALNTTPWPGRVGHVFVIVLENENYATTFASPPPSPYLALNLTARGRLLTQYYGTGHASLDNYIAMVSGQGPNVLTQADCAFYADFEGTAGGPDGQAVGQGCVYPKEIQTIGNQLTAAKVTWRQYAEDMANIPDAAPSNCRHQKINSQDTWQGSTSANDQYATRHVPFVYFHGVIDDQTFCDQHVVDLKNLNADLASTKTTPQLVFITPDVCSDGHDAACANPNQRGGYNGIEDFLRAWVPKITNSSAYKQDGLLIVTFDEADASTPDACCGEPMGPNSPMPGISGAGGGRVGAVLLSPCIQPGGKDDTPYNHYSFLRGLEDLWAVPHLGYAGMDGLVPLPAANLCNR